MSGEIRNLLTREMRGDSTTTNGISFSWDGDWFHVAGTATKVIGWSAYRSTTIPVKAGKTYTLSVEFADGMPDGYMRSLFQLFSGRYTYKDVGDMARNDHITLSLDQATLDAYSKRFQIWGPIIWGGATVDMRVRWMLVEGDQPAAWAPAEGEELAGGGAQMSANLWDSSTASMQIREDGTYLAGKAGTAELTSNVNGLASLTENQTIHMGASLRGADSGSCQPYVEYADEAGNKNWVGFQMWTPTADWQRFEGTCVVPSGMTVCGVGFSNDAATGDIEVSNPVFSYGSAPIVLASAKHVRGDIVRVPLAVCPLYIEIPVSMHW